MITITVTNRKAVGVPISDVTVGAVGIPVYFNFSEDWEGLSKIAVFKAGDTSVTQDLDAVEMAVFQNKTTVPHEVLTTAYERLWVGIYGMNPQGTVVTPTIWADIGAIQPGTELVDVDPSEPTPSWVAQVQAAAEMALDIAEDLQEEIGDDVETCTEAKTVAETSATSAAADALISEGFAVGKQDGSSVTSESPYYHNNASYYANVAGSASNTAVNSAVDAALDALKAEGYAVGKQNGADVESGSPYYHNNAKWYSDQSESWAVGGTDTRSGEDTNNAKYWAEQAAASAAAFVVDDTLTISGAAADAKVVGDVIGDQIIVRKYVPATFIQGSRNTAGTLDPTYTYRVTTDDKFTVPKMISYPIPDGYQVRITSFNLSTGVKIGTENNLTEFVTFKTDRSYVMTIYKIDEDTSVEADPAAMYAQMYRIVSSTKHLRIVVFGHSYSADSWQYVPFMLKNYGITCEIYLYYRGNGSIDQLVSQWEDTASTGVDAWGESHIRRYCHIDSRYTDCWDDSGGEEGYSAKMILETAAADGKIDLITLQTAPTEVYFVKSVGDGDPRKGYEPYVRQAIDLINASYDDAYALGWFCSYTRHLAYEGNVSEGYPAVSADTFDNKEDTLRAAETICTAEPFDLVIPAAAAVFSARTNDDLASTNISLYGNLWFSDRVHLQSGIPCYVTNATVVQSLFDKFFPGLSVYGDQFRVPDDDWITKRRCIMPTIHGSVLSTDEDLYDLAQKCAVAACEHPFEITTIRNSEDTTEIDFSDTKSRYLELSDAINMKVDKVNGKGLSTNDYTTAEKTKLSGIAAGAEVNVQSDWNQTSNSADDYIKNKPANLVQDANYTHITIDSTLANSGQAADAKATGDALSDLSDSITAIDGEVSDIAIYTLGLYPQETIDNEPIASFADGADNIPIKNLKVSVTPAQDLHGYDHPYPPGGGKNIAPMGTSGSQNGITFTVASDGKVTTSGTAQSSTAYVLCEVQLKANTQYVLSGCASGGAQGKYGLGLLNSTETDALATDFGSGATYTPTSDITAKVAIRYWYGQAVNGTFSPQLEVGSSPTSFAPYSNICPISGWTEANITRTGKNILDVSHASSATNVVSAVAEDGTVSFKDVSAQWADTHIGKMFLKAGEEYTISVADFAYGRLGLSTSPTIYPLSTTFVEIVGKDITWSGNIISRAVHSNTFTPAKSGYVYLYYCSDTNYASYHQVFSTTIQIEIGSSATEYEEYQGQTVEVAFPDEAGTVYGGTLTKNSDGTVTLVVDRACYTVNGWTGSVVSQTNPCIILTYVAKPGNNAQANPKLIASNVKTVSANDQYTNSITAIAVNTSGQIRLSVAGLTTKAQYNAWLQSNPVTYAYEIATPVSYTLTAEELGAVLRTLYGTNNIWADCGNITLTYRADPAIYNSIMQVEQYAKFASLISGIETGTNASQSYAQGKYFILNSKLCKAKTSIASGATFTLGTNYEITTVAAELYTALNS